MWVVMITNPSPSLLLFSLKFKLTTISDGILNESSLVLKYNPFFLTKTKTQKFLVVAIRILPVFENFKIIISLLQLNVSITLFQWTRIITNPNFVPIALTIPIALLKTQSMDVTGSGLSHLLMSLCWDEEIVYM